MTGPAIELAVHASGLGRRFGRYWALAHVDLEVAYGTSVWLRGSNGAGKTTLLRLISSLSTPTRGDLFVGGHDVTRHPVAARRCTSLVSHSLYLYSGLTARETLDLWARLGDEVASSQEVERRLDEVGLAAAADRRVGEFSAGMRKRLALARALLESPKVLLLDEPFSSLDRAGCELVEDWVRRFAADGGAVIMASHDHERSEALCESVVDLSQGQVIDRSDLSGRTRGGASG